MVRVGRSFFVLFIAGGIILAPFGVHAATQRTERLAGRILLQVQDKGEAWYVDPLSKTRAYLGRPADAFRVMRELGLGITTSNLEKISSSDDSVSGDRQFAKRFSGRILLQVQAAGKAWYVNPVDLKRYYLGLPSDAFALMRKLGLGISNADITTIPISAKYSNSQQYEPEFWKQQREQKSYAIHKNEAFGLWIAHPDQWTVEDPGLGDLYIKQLYRDEEFYDYKSLTAASLRSPTKNEQLMIRRHDKIGSQTLATYVEGVATRLKSDTDVWDVSSQPARYGVLDVSGFEIEYASVYFTMQVKSLSVFFLRRDGYVYSLTYRATIASYDTYLDAAKETFGSLQFFDPQPKADTLFKDDLKKAQFLVPPLYRRDLGNTNNETFYSPAYDFDIGYTADFSWDMVSLEKYVEDTFREDIVSKSATTLGGMPAIRISEAREGAFVVTVVAVKGEKEYSDTSRVYRLYFKAPDVETRDRFLPLFEQAVSSFQFIE